MSSRRLMKELKRWQEDPPAGISAAPQDNNMMLWNAVISGPEDTPWDGGMFKLIIQIPTHYPIEPPTVQFVSRMFHPNIYADGKICLDILQDMWSPLFHLYSILTSIQSAVFWKLMNAIQNNCWIKVFVKELLITGKIKEDISMSFLCDPNPDVPANSEAAQLFIENKRIYNRKIREIVEESLTRGEQLNQKTERLNQTELKVVEESLTRGEQLNRQTKKPSLFAFIAMFVLKFVLHSKWN